ncbi:MAG TPA: cytochrome c oxidase subunit II, partial [Actinomycetota bacterium]|nr:cytochrome c oxidase subunit II [Actinomycetota bacterium]
MFWISAVVFAVVVGLLVASIRRGRRDHDPEIDRSEAPWGEPFIAIAGVAVPALILLGVYVFSLSEMNALQAAGSKPAMTVEVSARDWWWEARYPNGAVTANEIHIPIGVPVRLDLTTRDVIHSFWVPRLQVKTDNIPGRHNYMWIQADRAGRYRGFCAEFCGLQHTNMNFWIVAEPQAEFDAWLDDQVADVTEAALALDGAEIFLSSSCAGCHALRGTTAVGLAGPDLTHLAARETLAGVLPNTRSSLEQFIRDPQSVKPGIAMPPAELTADELRAVV